MSPTPQATPSVDPLAPLVVFGRQLRERGLPVGTGRILTFCRSVAALGLTDRDSLYWAGRASLVGRQDDLAAYDDAFEDWYRSLGRGDGPRIELTIPSTRADRQLEWGEQPDELEITLGA